MTDVIEQSNEAFRVEQRGIDLIPDDERHLSASGLFWMWVGGIWNVEYLVYGTLLTASGDFGLSFGQALLAIVIGNLFFVFLGVASLQGPEVGTTTFTISRAPFGANGNRLPSLFNWMTQVGFEILGIYLIVQVAESMFQRGGVHVDDGLKVGIIVVAVLIQFVVPFLGHATITTVLRYLSFVFIVLFVIMAFLVVPHVHLQHFHQHSSLAGWTTALVLLVSAGGLGWTENGNDYSRYLPRSTPKAKTFFAAALGGAVPAILLELLGALACIVSQKATSVTAVPTSFASWFFWPFLVLALPQLFAINSLDLYSSGVTLQALGIPVKRWGAVVIDTLVAGAVTAVVVFKGNFYQDLSGFLDYIVVWLAPWFAILVVDWALRRGRYDPDALASQSGGTYWRNGGVNWKAVVSLLVGGAAALMWTDAAFYQPAYVGPLSSRTDGADLSWVLGIVVGGLLYLVLSFRSVPAETR